MDNLAYLAATVAVGDSEGRAVVNQNGVISVWSSDGLAIEAKVNGAVAFPCSLKGHVGRQEVVARLGRQAVGTGPLRPR